MGLWAGNVHICEVGKLVPLPFVLCLLVSKGCDSAGDRVPFFRPAKAKLQQKVCSKRTSNNTQVHQNFFLTTVSTQSSSFLLPVDPEYHG